MGCCGNKQDQTNEQKADGGCCDGGAMNKETCCKGSKIVGFIKMIFGKKCCGSADCKS